MSDSPKQYFELKKAAPCRVTCRRADATRRGFLYHAARGDEKTPLFCYNNGKNTKGEINI
jgi:hypothetical protein